MAETAAQKIKLPESFYLDNDVVKLSKSLIGKYLFTCIDGATTGGYFGHHKHAMPCQ